MEQYRIFKALWTFADSTTDPTTNLATDLTTNPTTDDNNPATDPATDPTTDDNIHADRDRPAARDECPVPSTNENVGMQIS